MISTAEIELIARATALRRIDVDADLVIAVIR
jgi:hypothetical protein